MGKIKYSLYVVLALSATWSTAAFAVPFSQGRTPSVELAQIGAADAAWALIAETDDQAALQEFIAQYPDSRHIPVARTRLAALRAGTRPPPAAAAQTGPKPAIAGTTTLVPPPPPGTGSPPADAGPPVVQKPPPTIERKPTTTEPKPPNDTRPPVIEAKPPVTRPPPVTLSGAPTQPTQSFERPHVGAANMNGLRFGWCLVWEQGCGKQAADTFCKEQGYDGARSFEREVTGGQTWLFAEPHICSGPNCAALGNVVCERPVKSPSAALLMLVPNPHVNRLPLGECLAPAHGCGQQAADTFCRAGGFARATRFNRSPEGTRAFHLGDQTVCDGPQCRALIEVSCSR